MHYLGRDSVSLAVLLIALAVLVAGCGSGSGGDEDEAGPLTVSAAASLTEGFEAYGEALPGNQRFSFAGSDQLAAQIRQGADPDVFASANTSYPQELFAEGLVSKPVTFAQNQLVIAVAPGSPVQALTDLTEPGLDLVLCAKGVPCGDYTREVLGRLPAGERRAILADVRAEESDVKGVLGKVAQGAADAGFVYASDAAAAAGEVEAIEVPGELEPALAYGVAVLRDAAEPAAAKRFVAGLLRGRGRGALAEAGFLPPP